MMAECASLFRPTFATPIPFPPSSLRGLSNGAAPSEPLAPSPAAKAGMHDFLSPTCEFAMSHTMSLGPVPSAFPRHSRESGNLLLSGFQLRLPASRTDISPGSM